MPAIATLSNVTALKFASSPMKILKGLTFMYNANWAPDGSNTLPFAFFHVTQQEEIIRNDVSVKRVVLNSLDSVVTPTGVMSVISDNIVPQPKTWRMQVLVPMKALLPFLDEMLGRTEAGLAFASTYLRGKDSADLATATDIAASGVAVIRLLTKLFDFGQSVALWTTSTVGMENVADYNKFSLEKMCQDRSIIRMKDWSGWTYKYGVITSCTLSKEPLDEDYYKGTIEFQEMPVLVTSPQNFTAYEVPNSFMQMRYQAVSKVVEGVLLR